MKQIVTEGIQLDRARGTRGTQITDASQIQSFGVFAYTQQGGVNKLYINNEQYTKGENNIFQAQNIYYWPGASLTFDFYTYSPYNANGLSLPGSPDIRILNYTVPTDVAQQQDLMLAVNNSVPGDNNAAVPLSFTHLLTAVNVVAGSQMIDGTIESISFSGLVDDGTLDMTNIAAGWKLQNLDRVTYTVNSNVAINHTEGQNLLGKGNTFLLLPQTLSETVNAITVVVRNSDGNSRTLTAPLSGEWKMGTTNTYRISITPEYELKFEDAEIPVQDAHYVSFTTKVEAGNLKGKNWSVAVSCDDNADATVLLTNSIEDNLKSLYNDGFWLDRKIVNGSDQGSARGTASVTDGEEGTIELRVFLPENVTEKDRTVTLNLSVDGKSVATKTVTQKCPAWDGNTGWEVLNDGQQGPWGFDSRKRVVYVYNRGWLDLQSLALTNLRNNVQSIVNQYDPNHRYATYGTFEYAGWLDTYTYPYVSIDYSGFNNLGSNASSSEDGLINTKELYGLAGPVYSNALGAALENVHKYGGYGSSAMVNRDDAQYRVPADVPTNETDVNFKSVLSEVLKKNAYNLVTTTTGTGDEQITTTAPHIEASAIKWYLPAYGQFGSMPDWSGTGPQASQIWSSTVAPNIGSVSQAYLGVGQDARTTTHYVRAARNR
ncbi:MAG: fimbrillin family protein [Phocaeicola sp.]|nr:fimbrillin family protein [Phocaeicola sp.]